MVGSLTRLDAIPRPGYSFLAALWSRSPRAAERGHWATNNGLHYLRIEGAVAFHRGTFRTASLREALINLSGFRSGTHPEFDPTDAKRCHSLLLAGQAILGADLHEWLFLLVTA